MLFPLIDLPWWGFVLVTLALTHVTIASVTIFLHRHQAHRTLDLHPVASHFFRFWLWLTTGTVTREWVAVHRKHHAKCESADDPHSPVTYGIRRVLFSGAELYQSEAKKPETLSKYGQNTPDDWLERHAYTRHSLLGIGGLLLAEVALFGPIGLTIWAVQMMWIPFFAAGVVNGLGHFWGYRSYATRDASRNIVPWGILIGGEELHNNHHAYAASARLSSRRWEFDIGWTYIRLLAALRLATVRKLAPMLRTTPGKTQCDADTVHAVVRHRYAVLAGYASTLRQTVRSEIRALRERAVPGMEAAAVRSAIRHWLQKEAATDLPARERAALARAMRASRVLRTIYAMRRDLAAVWNHRAPNLSEAVDCCSATATVAAGSAPHSRPELLVRQLEAWCQRAEASGIGALRQFSRTLRSYA